MKLTVVNESCEDMREIKDESISCIFTSPPYACAKDYGDTDHIGNDNEVEAYKEYIFRMAKVLIECWRVLQSGRYIAINIADIIQVDKYTREKKPITFDYMRMMMEIGFEYRDTIIWKKPQGLGGQKRFGNFMQHPYPCYYFPNNVYEPILVFKKPGKFLPDDLAKEKNSLDWRKFKDYQSDVWEINAEGNVNHPAPFPLKLPLIFIQLHTLKGETVLDPFLGSGTTLMACKIAGVNGIGYEINKDYLPLIEERVKPSQQGLNFDREIIKYEVLKR